MESPGEREAHMVIMNQMDSHVEGQLIGQHTHTQMEGRGCVHKQLLNFYTSVRLLPPSSFTATPSLSLVSLRPPLYLGVV